MCGCQRITYHCLCRHKERQIERCLIYQLREEGSCWAYCFPRCQATVQRHRLNRVCQDCEKYFFETYGQAACKQFIQHFLDYKASKGWAKLAIDPRTVPRNLLVNQSRHSAPARIATQPGRQRVEGEGEVGAGRGRGQPFPVHPPMASRSPIIRHATQRRREGGVAKEDIVRLPVPAIKLPTPAHLGDRRHSARVSKQIDNLMRDWSVNGDCSSADSAHFKLEEVSDCSAMPSPLRVASREGQGKGKGREPPLPADPGLFAVGEDSSADESEGYPDYDYGAYDSEDNADEDHAHVGERRVLTPFPTAKYSASSPSSRPVIIPELAHLAQGRDLEVARRSPQELEHPTPKSGQSMDGGKGKGNGKGKGKTVRNVDSLSDISIVKRLTKAARKISIPNYEWYDYHGKWVPRVMSPPRGRRRTRTPSPESASTPTPPSSPAAGPSGHNVLPSKKDRETKRLSAIDIAMAAHDVPEALIPGSANSSAISLAVGVGDVPEWMIPGPGHDSPNPNPSPNTRAIAANDAKRSSAVSIERSPSLYFVTTQHNHSSPTGASARVRKSPSHEAVTVPPPQRLNGVLIPSLSLCPHTADGGSSRPASECPTCRGRFFKERGLPSADFLREECRSAVPAQSPVLVSVRVPRRRYSCAVQSCYCRDKSSDGKGKGKDSKKCPSCRERDAIAKKMNVSWV
ncbi:hypothetical protein F5Y10DRAFT_285283 [Nemania abortiva]|nr:hypothetical protein F5Y10DRAFT_285283 [Nemania abortiva]